MRLFTLILLLFSTALLADARQYGNPNTDGDTEICADGGSECSIHIQGTDGFVGVGTDAPDSRMTVIAGSTAGSGTNGIRLKTNDGTQSLGLIYGVQADEGALLLQKTGSTTVRLRADGNSIINGGGLGIGAEPPTNIDLHIEDSGSDGEFPIMRLQGQPGDGSSQKIGQLDFVKTTNDAVKARILSAHETSGTHKANLIFYTSENASSGAVLERMRIAANGNIGMGESDPSGALHIRKDGDAALFIDSVTSDARLHFSYNDDTKWQFRNDASQTDRFQIIDDNGTEEAYLVQNPSDWVFPSDARLKHKWESIEGSLDKILKIKTGTYEWIDQETEKRYLGFEAQDVDQYFPELVDKSNTEKLGMGYARMVVPLTKAIQEQQAIIEDLKARIEVLENN